MLDLLLCFPSRDVAVQFGAAQGFTVQDGNGEWQTTAATHQIAIAVIGEHFTPNGETTTDANGHVTPILQGDGQWWVMVRAVAPIPVPTAAEQFIAWRSDSDQPRPTAPQYPSNTWS